MAVAEVALAEGTSGAAREDERLGTRRDEPSDVGLELVDEAGREMDDPTSRRRFRLPGEQLAAAQLDHLSTTVSVPRSRSRF